jgi:hypothetical protein
MTVCDIPGVPKRQGVVEQMKFCEYVKFRKERFGGVLFETRSEKVFALNATAAAVASEIEAGTPRTAIADKLKTAFPGDDPARIETEATAFVQELIDNGLAEEV